jgi:serine/threonine protein kinase
MLNIKWVKCYINLNECIRKRRWFTRKLSNRYLIDKLGRSIGEGTFGVVRLGTHILTDEKVAVKTLQKDKIV